MYVKGAQRFSNLATTVLLCLDSDGHHKSWNKVACCVPMEHTIDCTVLVEIKSLVNPVSLFMSQHNIVIEPSQIHNYGNICRQKQIY